jgi:hypothetical protein
MKAGSYELSISLLVVCICLIVFTNEDQVFFLNDKVDRMGCVFLS